MNIFSLLFMWTFFYFILDQKQHLFFVGVHAASVSPTYAPATTYMQTNFAQIIVSGFSGSTINQNYTITFANPLSAGGYQAAIAFKQINLWFYTNDLQTQLKIVNTASASSLIVNLQVANPNVLTYLYVDYFVMDPNYHDSIYVFFFQSANSSLNYNIDSITPYSENFTLSTSVTSLTSLQSITMYSGFSFTATNIFNIDTFPQTTFLNTTKVQIKIKIIIVDPVILNYFGIYVIAYVQNDLSTKGYTKILSGYFDGGPFSNSTMYTFNAINSFVYANTMFIGIKSFHVINENFFKFRIIISQPSSFQLILGNNFEYAKFQYLMFLRFSCSSSPYNFFNENDALCYDQNCSLGYYFISIGGISWCKKCPYFCYECNSTSCTNCNTNTTNRILSGNKCVPLPGYYDDGISLTAIVCDSPCQNCQNSSTNCTSCVTLYYLDYVNNQCLMCPTGCDSCFSDSNCTLCSADYVINSSSLLCDLDCSVNSIECLSCYVFTPSLAARLLLSFGQSINCLICNQSNGYFLNPSTEGCQICSISNCLICSTFTQCSQCDAANLYQLDLYGGCIYCPYVGCLQCDYGEGQYCLTCDQANNYFMNATYECQLCTLSNCDNCSSLTQCLNCSSMYFLNSTTKICSLCSSVLEGCLDCIDQITCSICDISALFTLNSLNLCEYCNSSLGFVINNVSNLCQPPCNITGCISCLTSSKCRTCDTISNYFLHISMTFCTLCTLSQCISCASLSSCSVCNETNKYFLNNSTGLCQICAITQCITCVNLAQCSTCNQTSNYFLNSTTYLCDLCRINGCLVCSSLTTCSICDNANDYYLNMSSRDCYYCNSSCMSPPMLIDMKLNSLQKITNKNKIILSFSLYPSNLPEYSTINWNSQITTDIQNAQYSVFFDPNSQSLQVLIDYIQDLSSTSTKTVTLNTLTLTVNGSIITIPSKSLTVSMIASNNQKLSYYEDNVYEKAKIIEMLSTIIGYLSLILMIIGLIVGKLIVIEALAVIQISFMSLITLTNLSPTFSALLPLKLSFGYNMYEADKSYLNSQTLSNNIKGLCLSQILLKNYNVMFLFIGLPLLSSLILKILLTFVQTFKQSFKLKKLYQKILYETTFYGILICSFLFLSCVIFGLVSHLQKIDSLKISDLIFEVILLSLYFLYFLLLYKYNENFGQFFNSFTPMTKMTYFYLFVMIQRLIIAIVLSTAFKIQYANIIILLILLCVQIILLVFKPYHKPKTNYRPIIVTIFSILISLIYEIEAISQNPIQIVDKYGPFVIIFLLLLTILISIVYLIKKFISDWKQLQKWFKMQISQKQQHSKIEGMEVELIPYYSKNRANTVDEMLQQMIQIKKAKKVQSIKAIKEKPSSPLPLLQGNNIQQTDQTRIEKSDRRQLLEQEWQNIDIIDTERVDKLLQYHNIKSKIQKINQI